VNVKKQLGAKIKRLRLKHDLTQDELAEKMGLATRTLCGIENGENFVKSDTLERFCEVFGISCSELFAFDHIRPQEELVEEVISDLKNLHDRTKIEAVYKLVKSVLSE